MVPSTRLNSLGMTKDLVRVALRELGQHLQSELGQHLQVLVGERAVGAPSWIAL